MTCLLFLISTFPSQVKSLHKLEMEAWLDLASIYTKLESWHDSNICLDKAESINSFSSKCWHVKGEYHCLLNSAIIYG
jgi:hypothetical protein